MQFYPVRRHSRLTMQEVEHPDSGNSDWYICRLETGGHVEFRVKFRPRVCNAVQEWAAAPDAMGRRYLTDHSLAITVPYYQVIILVGFELILGKCRIYYPDRGLGRLHSVIARNR